MRTIKCWDSAYKAAWEGTHCGKMPSSNIIITFTVITGTNGPQVMC